MHVLKTVGIWFAAALAIGVTSSNLLAADRVPVPFAGTSSGIDVGATPGPTGGFDILAAITGTATQVGRFTETLDYHADLDAQGGVFSGVGVITAADGSKIFLDFEGTIPGLFQRPFPLDYSETFVITGGTGRFAGAKGDGEINGVDYGFDVGFEQDFDGVLIKAGK